MDRLKFQELILSTIWWLHKTNCIYLQAASDSLQGAQVQGEGGAEACVQRETPATVLDQETLIIEHSQCHRT